jgi:predicted DNA-binding transcriptional regulator YafY
MKAPHFPTKSATTTKRKRGSGTTAKKRKKTKRQLQDAEASEAQPSPKRGKKEEYSARIPRARQVFALFLRNQNEAKRKFPTNAEIGKALQPDDPLGQAAVRAILDMMRDDLGMPVDYVEERGGHGFTEPVAGFPLDAISEEQAYYLIQSVQMLGVHRHSKMFADIRNAVKRACLGICFALNIDFEDIEEAISFHVVGFDAPAPVDPELFKQAMRAILQKQEVTLEHRSVKRRGEVKRKTVEPLHLAMINHALYLWHYDPELEGTKDEEGKPVDPIRKFALTRIGALAATGRKCEARAFDVHERVQRGFGAFDDEKAEDIVVHFTPKIAPFILERKWHPTQTVEELADGGLKFGLHVARTPELEAFIARWAGEVEVISPAPLRKRIRQLGAALERAHMGEGKGDLR